MRTVVRHTFPDGYRPVSFCRSCGRDFAGDSYFDSHRTGDHQVKRRCRSDEELRSRGLRPMTQKEMLAGRHRRRAGFGVELWFNPDAAVAFSAARFKS